MIPFNRPIRTLVNKQPKADSIYDFKANSIYKKILKEALSKPGKLVYINKLYCKPILVFILPRFNIFVVVIIVVDF